MSYKGVNPDLEAAVSSLLLEVTASGAVNSDNKPYSLLDKMKVIDRAINLEKIRLKVSDDDYGSGLLDADDEETEETDQL